MNQAISVSTLNNQIKSLLETTFLGVYVEGEISNLTYHNSGHIYFSIKDQHSTLSCVMFRGNAQHLKFRLEVGMKINISGSITAYVPRGNYQLLCNKIEPSGQGSLALAYEQLKKKLEAKGYFLEENKKPLPLFPKHIAIVTSPTGAAIEDMKKVALHRWPLSKLTLIPTLVQGEGSKESIVRSIKIADALCADVMIVGRGGGSIEDLWAFNEEIVADAIFEAKTPIISAVGHESDFLISDFVSDKRAATPSNAIEIVLPDSNEYRMYLDSLSNQFSSFFKKTLFNKEQELKHIFKLFEQHSFDKRFQYVQKEIDLLKHQMNNTFVNILLRQEQKIENLKNIFELNNPKMKQKDGYVQLSINNKITNLDDIKKDDIISLQSVKNNALCKVLENNKL